VFTRTPRQAAADLFTLSTTEIDSGFFGAGCRRKIVTFSDGDTALSRRLLAFSESITFERLK
jgi:hypothetical protein